MTELYSSLTDVFHDVFEDDEIVVTPELTAADVPEWDSLSHIRLILALQKRFNIKFSAAQAASMKNVGELAAFIEARLASA